MDIKTEAKRVDVAFTMSRLSGQSWLATSLALAAPGKVPPATLPSGEYILEVVVSCENGKGDAKIIKLISPNNWEDLRTEEVKDKG
ncbi:hypothetical protein ACFLVK_01445 [Chloroflexota bacterium]